MLAETELLVLQRAGDILTMITSRREISDFTIGQVVEECFHSANSVAAAASRLLLLIYDKSNMF